MDRLGFYAGKLFNAYEFLGAHPQDGGVTFRTFAPNAARVEVIGDFNGWSGTPMGRGYDINFHECQIEDAQVGMRYKYRIFRKDGTFLDHCDPYGFGMELRPQNASIIRDLSAYTFHDDAWMQSRTDGKDRPLNIYELHLGSWKKDEAKENGWYSYREIADDLIRYVKELGYNYIEFMPLSEHPSDESWGYQNTGFFSPTSRYGTAAELMELVDRCHQNGIGVIMDFVPVHFALDDYGLADYDGTPLYEYPHPDVGVSEWGSRNFIHSRGEIRSFLKSAANYWIKEYHFDGLRMDAIRNIIFWQGDTARGANRNALEFIQSLNRGLKGMYPSLLLAAEDSSAYPGVTTPVEAGGLGFDYKWDMGWMNDTLAYFSAPVADRKRDYHKLTFSMMYFYDEKFLLPLSHDEVVHGKGTILQKMHGEYAEKFPQARALFMYMIAHPGKKLNFMGNELAQLREWDEQRELDWDIRQYPNHDSFYQFIRALNRLYRACPALWAKDFDKEGFHWLDCAQAEKCVYAFERTDGRQSLVAVFNFSDQAYPGFRLETGSVPALKLALSSDLEPYGGRTKVEADRIYVPEQGALPVDLPAYCGMYFLAA